MSPHTAQIKTGKTSRISWLVAGCISVCIGFIGIIVPGLPTTVFMLIAAACFYRSSQRFYDWVISHKLFGHHIKKGGNLHLEKLPKDSWRTPIIYVKMKDGFELISYGADRKEGGDDEGADILYSECEER